MKAVILARVSSKEQEDGHSLEAQLGNLETYARKKDLEVIQVFRVIESSTKGLRPEFERMIDFIREQPKRVALIVDCVDRLQRSFTHTPVLDALMRDDRLEIHFVREGNILDKDATSAQKLMWNMGVVMAQSYTDQLSDNVKRSVKHKISKGEWIGRAPLGYLNTEDPEKNRNTVILDPERAFLVKRLFQEYSTGASSLTELQRKSKGWGLRTVKGNIVSTQTLHRLIQDPFYYGIMTVKGQQHPHCYPPLIDREMFNACQRVRLGNGRAQAVRETKAPFILRGLIKCAVSGRKVTCDLKKGRYVYLICHDPENQKKKLFIPEARIMEQIGQAFKSLQIPSAVLAEIVDHLKQTHESEKVFHHDSIKRLHGESEELDRRLDKLTDLLLDGSITKDIHNKKHQDLTQRRYEINKKIEQHHEGNSQFKIALTMLVTLASKAWEIFESSTIDEKRQLIGYVFSNLEMEGATLCYSLKKPFDLFVNLASYQEWRPLRDSNPCRLREREVS